MTTINAEVRPPEWWTSENTAAWARQVWGDPKDWGEAMKGWGVKIREAVGRAGASCYRPLSARELVEMRASDSRPANPCYYDGAPILAYKPLVTKRTKKAEA
jgi:hypothetical protein